MVFTLDVGYWEPLHYYIKFYNHDRSINYSLGNEFDSTATSPLLKISNAHLKMNTVMHSFSFDVDNSDDDVPTDWIKAGNQVKVMVWKNSSYKFNNDAWLYSGFIDYPSEERAGFQSHKFHVQTYEVKQALYDSNVTFVKDAPLDFIDQPQSNNATKYQINKLIKDLLTNKDYTLLGDDSLADRIASFDTTFPFVSDDVNVIFPKPRIRNKSAGEGIDEWSDIIGFNWYFVYPNSNPSLVVKYPSHEYVPIIMKAGDTKDINADLVQNTSYITDPFQKISSSSQESNVASVMSAVSKIQDAVIASKTVNKSSTLMNYKAIAMPFTTNETNFTELTMLMSKIGEPESPKNRVNGAIYLNQSSKPVGKVLEFEIPLSDIEAEPTNVTVDLTENKRFIENLAGTNNFYIVIYQRSGKDGDPNHNTTDGVRVHRDINTDGGSLIADNGDRVLHSSLVWKPHGPSYVFSIKSSLNRLYVATNQELVNQIGKKEPPALDFGFIEDVNVAQRYLSSFLYYASLYKVPIPLQVTVPNDFLFLPYQVIPNVFEAYTFPGGIDIEIQEVEYDFSQNTNECSISGLALIDGGFPTTWGCSGALA